MQNTCPVTGLISACHAFRRRPLLGIFRRGLTGGRHQHHRRHHHRPHCVSPSPASRPAHPATPPRCWQASRRRDSLKGAGPIGNDLNSVCADLRNDIFSAAARQALSARAIANLPRNSAAAAEIATVDSGAAAERAESYRPHAKSEFGAALAAPSKFDSAMFGSVARHRQTIPRRVGGKSASFRQCVGDPPVSMAVHLTAFPVTRSSRTLHLTVIATTPRSALVSASDGTARRARSICCRAPA